MKTILDYIIWCTEEQTKKALELGALLFTFSESFANDYRTSIHDKYCSIPPIKEEGYEDEVYADIPTAEQLSGWLEEQKIFVHIIPCVDISCSWYIASKGYSKYGYTSDIKVCKNRKEATLAAIDAALEYLSKNKK